MLQGLRLAGADMIIGVDINRDRKEWGEKFGMTHFVNAKEVGADIVPYLVNMTKRHGDLIDGADYTFDCTGNTKVMRQALESLHRGWGKSVIIGVAGAGQEVCRGPSNWSRAATGCAPLSAARAAAPTCRRSSSGTWRAIFRSIR